MAQGGQQCIGYVELVATLDVVTDRRQQEHARTPRRNRLVHETVDEALADQRHQYWLVFTRTGNADHNVGKLLDDLDDQ